MKKDLSEKSVGNAVWWESMDERVRLPYLYIQAHLRDFPGSFPEHHNEASCNHFASVGSSLHFVKIAKSVNCNKVK